MRVFFGEHDDRPDGADGADDAVVELAHDRLTVCEVMLQVVQGRRTCASGYGSRRHACTWDIARVCRRRRTGHAWAGASGA